ncbi:MAG: amidohydrolase family protein [Planctomycetaceae bacterium]|nr:amidohydrolase family protein [Planctomycetaceae bacterium]
MRTLIEQATCVLPEGTRTASILIDNGVIEAIDPVDVENIDERINARGYVLIPGVIDDQVHFRDPGLTHKEDLHTGSLACAKGGVTTFFEMPNTNPATITKEELEKKYELASTKCVVNFGFYVGATPDNVRELQQVDQKPGIMIFIGSSTCNLPVVD